MPATSRKQKEIADRHRLFLDIAYRILVADGFQLLNMNKIADIAEYSKGTVYQHFHCKEEVLIQLCNQEMTLLSDLFRRAGEFDGNHRERMVAIFLAQDIWARLRPKNRDMMQTLCADGVKDKVSAVSLSEHSALESGLIKQVASVVTSALDEGDLPQLTHLDPFELVFGLWSLGYGGQTLRSLNLPLQNLGINNPQNAVFYTMTAVLDGLGWLPLSSEFDYYEAALRIEQEIFAKESDRIRST